MRQSEVIAEYYQHHVEIGELEPENVPTAREMAAEWEVSSSTAQTARTKLVRAGLAFSVPRMLKPIGPFSEKDMARFWAKVALPDANGCCLWTATTQGEYGGFSVDRRMIQAHRVSYTHLVGQVPQGLELDHVWEWGCRSKLCVAPAHLEPVTRSENRARAVARVKAEHRWRASIRVWTELDAD